MSLNPEFNKLPVSSTLGVSTTVLKNKIISVTIKIVSDYK
jgi:hypothetical protein